MFKDKIVVITGGARGLGKKMADEFAINGAIVCVIDILDNPYFVGDIAEKTTLERFAAKVIEDFGRVDVLINNAKPPIYGIDDCSFEQFQYAMNVGVTAPFYLAKLFAEHFTEDGCIINIASARDRMSQKNTESYTAAKGGIAALTHGLAMSMNVRVNSISPGWIDTTGIEFHGADNTQHPVGRVGVPEDISNLALFLASDKASFITGENICVDGGMTKRLIYHGDEGWSFLG